MVIRLSFYASSGCYMITFCLPFSIQILSGERNTRPKMKVPFSLLLCSVLTLLCASVNGDLGRLFGGIKDSVDQLHRDVKNVLHVRNEDRIVFDQSEEAERNFDIRPTPASFVRSEKQTEPAVIASSVKSSTTTVDSSTVSKPLIVAPPVVGPSTTPSATVDLAPKSNATTDKDGRENFQASCSTGYQRTSDGRCLPTF